MVCTAKTGGVRVVPSISTRQQRRYQVGVCPFLSGSHSAQGLSLSCVSQRVISRPTSNALEGDSIEQGTASEGHGRHEDQEVDSMNEKGTKGDIVGSAADLQSQDAYGVSCEDRRSEGSPINID